MTEPVFFSLNKPRDIGVMAPHAEYGKQNSPADYNRVAAAPEEGNQNSIKNKHGHGTDRDVPAGGNKRYGDSETEQRGYGKTEHHDTAAGCYTLAAFEAEENGPVMADDHEKAGEERTFAGTGEKKADPAGEHCLYAVTGEGEQAVFPAH